jgi:L-aminopeptidase/D-esterase-like protein
MGAQEVDVVLNRSLIRSGEPGRAFDELAAAREAAENADRPLGRAPVLATTLGVVATDATLTKAHCTKLAGIAHDGLARAVRPAHTYFDGDTVFAAATGAMPLRDSANEIIEICALAANCMARAIARGVYEATALPFPGALRSWRERFGQNRSAP